MTNPLWKASRIHSAPKCVLRRFKIDGTFASGWPDDKGSSGKRGGLSRRNSAKIDRIQRCIENSFNVPADKRWILPSDLPNIQHALDLAEERRLVAYNIMTERYEAISILQRELVNTTSVFGAILPGNTESPAVFTESVHRSMKSVAGVPSLRPPWFFDLNEQGEALSDVGIHMVDPALWTAFPDQPIDYRKQIKVIDAKRWPTTVTIEQWLRVTGAQFPLQSGELL